MKIIKAKAGNEILVDDFNYDRFAKHSWQIEKSYNVFYARRNTSNGKTLRMHRLVINAQPGEIVDHIDGNGLNNQLNNLRIATNQQNSFNQRTIHGKSKYKGVYKWKTNLNSPWTANININKNKIALGFFNTQEQAAIAYDQAALILFREYAFINFTDQAQIQKILETMSPKQLKRLEINRLRILSLKIV